MARGIYKGTGGGYPVYSVDGNYIYSGTGEGYPVYRIDGNYIYKGTGGGYPVYRIDGNYIYEGTGGGYPVYRIDGNYIYEGTGGGYPVYTIEDNVKSNVTSNNTSSYSNDSSRGASGVTGEGILATITSLIAGIYIGNTASSFGIGFIAFLVVYTLVLCLVEGIKKNIGNIFLCIIFVLITLYFMN